ncbi:MAG: hypothetical protein R3D58_05330 [Saprospiraceae bacterium]|jgi:hypothetical protein|nr:hypothetical protein [Lewinellaceae bacterium]
MLKLLLVLSLTLFLTACADDPPLDFPEKSSADATSAQDHRPEGIRLTETGHQKASISGKETLAFDLEWSNRNGLKASLIQRMDGSAIHIRYTSGTQAWWDGRRVRLEPAPGDTISAAQARFDLRAWHYWSCLPYKLSDPGTRWQALPDRTLDGRVCAVGRLSFEPGTGDTPDDWFAVFTDRKSHLIRAAFFVATFNHDSKIEAAKTPQMIRYQDYNFTRGVPVARRWVFSGWQTDSLEGSVPLGEVFITNVRFGVDETELNAKDKSEARGRR